MAVITVIGAGNGAHALAADCKLGDAEVRMFEFTRYNNKVKGILNSRRIRLEGLEMNYEHFKRSGTAVLDMVTYDMAEAVHGADHILISVQAQGFQQVFEELAPLLEDGQTVSIFPDNFGSLILRRIMKEKGIKTRVIVAGYDSLVYGARLVEYNNLETETDVVNITYRENEIRVDTLPSCDYDEYLKRCKEIPALDDEFAKDVSEFDTLKDLKADLKKKITAEREETVKRAFEDALMEQVAENITADVPDAMVEAQSRQFLDNFKMQLAQQGLQYVHGFGALQVDLAGLLRDVGQGHAFGQAGTQGGKVPGGAGGIDHHHEVVRAETVDDAVIQHRPLFRQQEAVAATARGERGQVVAHGGGQRRIGTGAPDAELAHMADIEQTGMLTGMLVLHEDALILDGHQPARERRHLGAVGHMPVRERGLEFGHGSFLLSGAAPAG